MYSGWLVGNKIAKSQAGYRINYLKEKLLNFTLGLNSYYLFRVLAVLTIFGAIYPQHA